MAGTLAELMALYGGTFIVFSEAAGWYVPDPRQAEDAAAIVGPCGRSQPRTDPLDAAVLAFCRARRRVVVCEPIEDSDVPPGVPVERRVLPGEF